MFMIQEKSAGLVIFQKNNGELQYLLLHYSHGHWGFPKGNIEFEETEKAAAIREAIEETGLRSFRFITDFKEQIEYFYRKRGETIHKQVIYFLAEIEEGDVKLSFEHIGYKWLTFDEALNLVYFENDKKVLWKANDLITK